MDVLIQNLAAGLLVGALYGIAAMGLSIVFGVLKILNVAHGELIMIGGYLVSALIGTAIGYYILMRIDPSYNWWNLRLPGLREAPSSGSAPVEFPRHIALVLAPFAADRNEE